MRPYLNAHPLANGPSLGSGLAQFNASYSNPSSLNAYSIRLDHAINPKLSLFGRYNYSPSSLDHEAHIFLLVPSSARRIRFHPPYKPERPASPSSSGRESTTNCG